MSETLHLDNVSIVDGDVTVDLNLSKLSENLGKAQWWLDTQIMTDMVPYMPMVTGNFIQRTREQSESWAGNGVVCAGVPPMGRFLYEGKKMVDSVTGRGPFKINSGAEGEFIFRFRKGAKLVPTNEPLNFTKTFHPGAVDHWFDAAKAANEKDWIDGVKKIAGGDSNG